MVGRRSRGWTIALGSAADLNRVLATLSPTPVRNRRTAKSVACRRVRAAARGVCALTTLGDARGVGPHGAIFPRALSRLSCTQSLERPHVVAGRRRAQASSACKIRAICVAHHCQISPGIELDCSVVLAGHSHCQRCPRRGSIRMGPGATCGNAGWSNAGGAVEVSDCSVFGLSDR
jgi:hypothetical protein